MAKKKASAKKPILKKVAKKTVSKKAAKSVTKKTSTKAAKKSVPAKKAAPKKSAAKVTKKVAAKKTVAKKTATKKSAPVKAGAKKMAAPKVAPMKPAVSNKKLDLSNFVTPLDDRLIVQLSGAEKMTPGGLYIPDTVSDVSGNLHGQVVAVGRGHLGKKGHVLPMDVKVGDKVVFAEHAGSKINIQNEDLIILREVDVMGVVSK